jgi:hypothetical protein
MFFKMSIETAFVMIVFSQQLSQPKICLSMLRSFSKEKPQKPDLRQPLTTGAEAGDADATLNVITRCWMMIQFPLLIPFLLKRLFA